MKELIKGQSLRIDNHTRGNNQPINWGTGLHIHKTMNNDRYNGAEILIPLDSSAPISYRLRKKNQDVEQRLKNEIEKVFKRSKQKNREFGKYLFDEIQRFAQELPHSQRIQKCKDIASYIATSFNLSPIIEENIKSGILEKIQEYYTLHFDKNSNQKTYILQDIEGNNIRIGEDLEFIKENDLKFTSYQ